jgi:lysophospholipase
MTAGYQMKLISTAGNPAPGGVVAGKVRTPDEVALRFARWDSPASSRGTVCVFTGRGEFIEKYFETVRDLRKRGFTVAMMDWRGQGHSSRQLPDPRKGHVESFSDFEIDLRRSCSEWWFPIVRRPILHWLTRWAARCCCASRTPASGGLSAQSSLRR